MYTITYPTLERDIFNFSTSLWKDIVTDLIRPSVHRMLSPPSQYPVDVFIFYLLKRIRYGMHNADIYEYVNPIFDIWPNV